MVLVVAVVAALLIPTSRRLSVDRPGKLQQVLELTLSGLHDLIEARLEGALVQEVVPESAAEAAGIEVTPVVNHDDSETQASMEITPTTFVRSIYFTDPDGIMLEFAAWTREMNEDDLGVEPQTAT